MARHADPKRVLKQIQKEQKASQELLRRLVGPANRKRARPAIIMELDEPSFNRAIKYIRRVEKRTKRETDNILRDLGQHIRRELVLAVQAAFPDENENTPLIRAIVSRYNPRTKVLIVGFDTRGIANPTTGRPLSEYFVPIQSFTNSFTRTNRPQLIFKVGNRTVISKVVTERIMPWVVSTLSGVRNPLAVAVAIARDFEARGMPRPPVIAKVFKDTKATSVGDALTDRVLKGFEADKDRAISVILNVR